MSALAVHAGVAAVVPTATAAPAANAAEDAGFGALLGEMARPKSADAQAQPDKAAKDKPDPAKTTDGSTLTALQSLEAALNGLGALTKAAPVASPVNSATPAPATAATAPLGSALAAAAGALDAQSWDASGKTPLKSLLQADPSLGMREFQMKTYLAPTGATPARSGATALAAGAAWNPLSLAPSAKSQESAAVASAAEGAEAAASGAAKSTGAASGRAQRAETAPRAAAPRDGSAPDSHAVPVRASDGPSAVSATSSAGGGARRDGDAAAKSSDAAAAVATTASGSASATPSLTVPLATLPAFIADQAQAFVSSASDSGSASTSASAAAATPKAAQAVKELNITLDPADLGQMTLKLRLADGKLSVTIGVVNPSTLTSIEDDRALIAARLGGADQALGDLVIQRQAGAPATQETASSHAPASDTGADPSSSDGEAESSDLGGRRPGPGAGAAFSQLLV
jgi:hypothetical protein